MVSDDNHVIIGQERVARRVVYSRYTDHVVMHVTGDHQRCGDDDDELSYALSLIAKLSDNTASRSFKVNELSREEVRALGAALVEIANHDWPRET